MLLTSHGLVLFYIAAYPEASIPQMTTTLGLSERRVGVILRDLREQGMVQVTRVGRRNRYKVNGRASLRHPCLSHVQLADILDKVVPREGQVVWPTAEQREEA
jgi:hypothetical protein